MIPLGLLPFPAAPPPAYTRPAPVAPAAGAALGRLVIPRVDLDATVHEGTTAAVLDRGPGHYPTSALPGRGETVGIAGHRVTHTRPFLRINALQKGDTIALVTTSGRRYEYEVFTMRIVPPRQVWVLGDRGSEQLVLTACHPPTKDQLRLVVLAKRVA